jgi:hypothetical protein
MSSSTMVFEDLSLSDLITPVCYTRLLLIYNYIIEDLEKPLLEFLHQYCPSAFKRITANKLVDSVHQPTLYTCKNDTDTSVSSFNIEQTDIFPYGRIPDERSPLFFLHQLILKDGTILAIGIHHRLTDGHGFINLLHRFSIWMTGQQVPSLFEHDRSLIRMKIAPAVTYEHFEYYIGESSASSALHLPEVETDVIIKRYKKLELFRTLSITSKNVSFNDVLVAWLTKIISQIRRVPSENIVKVGMPSNGRTVLDLGESYFGNCIFYMYFPFLMADLESLSINDLSERVHNERKRYMTQAYMQSALAYIEDSTKKAHSIIYPIFNLFGAYDLAFTNWSRFPMYKIDFGNGPPKRVFLPPGKRRNGMITILPTTDGDHEIELYIRLDKRFAEELSQALN